jgi:hypothetical protein
MENQELVSPSRQCSSTLVGYGQGFLSTEQRDNIGEFSYLSTSDFYLFPQLKWALKEQRFCNPIYIIKNATDELKSFYKVLSRNVSSTFTVADSRFIFVQGVYFEGNVS